MSGARASVALAACNGERFLGEQVRSILGQLGSDDELVISCDPSADTTLEIAEGFARGDGRVRAVRNACPGITSNFNSAMSLCTGDFVFVSDQDDVWLTGKRDRIVAELERTGADLAIHNGVHVDEAGRVVSEPFFEMWRIGSGRVRNFVLPRYSGCCMAFSRDAARYLLPMPEGVANYDHWLGMACELFGSVSYVDDVLLAHRLHGANATTPRRPLRAVASARAGLALALLRRRKEARSHHER